MQAAHQRPGHADVEHRLPADLPHEIEIDLSKLASFEDAITIGSLTLPKGVETTVDPSATLATVDYATASTPGVNANLTPANDIVVWQNVTTIGTRAVNLTSFQLRNLGSIGLNDVRNLRLAVRSASEPADVPACRV